MRDHRFYPQHQKPLWKAHLHRKPQSSRAISSAPDIFTAAPVKITPAGQHSIAIDRFELVFDHHKDFVISSMNDLGKMFFGDLLVIDF
jgi:hypothetical protein